MQHLEQARVLDRTFLSTCDVSEPGPIRRFGHKPNQLFVRMSIEFRVQMFDMRARRANLDKQLRRNSSRLFALHAHEQHFTLSLGEAMRLDNALARIT